MTEPEDDDEDPETRNEISDGNFNGPVGQFGSVQGDVNMSNTSNPRSQEEEDFWAQYRERKRQQWQAEAELRARRHQQQQEQQVADEAKKRQRDDSKIIWIGAAGVFALLVVVAITVAGLSGM